MTSFNSKSAIACGCALLLSLAACGQPTQYGVDLLADAGDAGDFEPFDTPPVVTSYPPPSYPSDALTQQIEGMVTVAVVVATDGSVENAEVLRSSNAIFDASAVSAARRFRFEPATRAGRPVRCRVAVPVYFRLD